MAKLLKAFAYVWGTVAVAAIIVGAGWTWYARGFGALLDMFSPFNVINYAVIVITLLPAIAANSYADKIQSRQRR